MNSQVEFLDKKINFINFDLLKENYAFSDGDLEALQLDTFDKIEGGTKVAYTENKVFELVGNTITKNGATLGTLRFGQLF